MKETNKHYCKCVENVLNRLLVFTLQIKTCMDIYGQYPILALKNKKKIKNICKWMHLAKTGSRKKTQYILLAVLHLQDRVKMVQWMQNDDIRQG